MSEFKPGDRVRVKARKDPRMVLLFGPSLTGTILRQHPMLGALWEVEGDPQLGVKYREWMRGSDLYKLRDAE